MKRMTIAIATVLLTAQVALAQQPPAGRPPRGGPPIEKIANDLGLDDTQKAEVKRILEEQRARHETERQQYQASGQRPTPEEMRTTLQQHDRELTQALSGVLTAEQLAKFKSMQEQRRQNMKNNMGNGPPPPAGE
jgi:Spy/CpxP family protein refolding chaperone